MSSSRILLFLIAVITAVRTTDPVYPPAPPALNNDHLPAIYIPGLTHTPREAAESNLKCYECKGDRCKQDKDHWREVDCNTGFCFTTKHIIMKSTKIERGCKKNPKSECKGKACRKCTTPNFCNGEELPEGEKHGFFGGMMFLLALAISASFMKHNIFKHCPRNTGICWDYTCGCLCEDCCEDCARGDWCGALACCCAGMGNANCAC